MSLSKVWTQNTRIHRLQARLRSTLTQSVSTEQSAQEEWCKARPFLEIPGPKPLPVVGNLWRFVPGIGPYAHLDMLRQQQRLREEYGDIVRISKIFIRKDAVWVFTPELAEQIYREEGPYPIREGLNTLHYYRTVVRKDKYEGVAGSVTSQGKDWHNFRSKVNQPLMQTTTARRYIQPINDVAEEMVQRMRCLRDEKNELPEDFINELYKWALESIGYVALDKRIGCLAPDLRKDSEPQKMIDAVQTMFEGFYKLDIRPSLWKYVSTPMWRRMVREMDYFGEVVDKYVNESIERRKQYPDREPSILDRIYDVDPRVASVMSLDLMLGGVDTTSHALGSILFHLAKNPEKQEILREEAKRILPDSPSQPITTEALDEMKYLKACIRESLRLYPIVLGNIRETIKDTVLGGYQIPKGTDVFMCHMLMSHDSANYDNSKEFLPERWIRGNEQAHSAHPFVTLPFGFGPRTCLGRRFAELEIKTLITKIMRNFWVEYHYGDELKFFATSINSITSPLKFRLLERN